MIRQRQSFTKVLGFSIESEAEFDSVEKVDQAVGLNTFDKDGDAKAGNIFRTLALFQP